MAEIYYKTIKSNIEPTYKEVLWLRPNTDPDIENTLELLAFGLNGWEVLNKSDDITETDPIFTTSPASQITVDNINDINKIPDIEARFDDYQPLLTAGDYISIENNTISVIGLIEEEIDPIFTEWVNSRVLVAGESSTATGATAGISFGYQTHIGGNNDIGIGISSQVSGTGTIAIGSSIAASGSNSISLGNSVNNIGTYAVALGFNSRANAGYSVTIGPSSTVSATYGISVGYLASCTGNSSISIGYLANAGANTVVLGSGSYGGTGSGNTILGGNSGATDPSINAGNNCIAVGRSSRYTGSDSIAIGVNSSAPAQSTIVGYGASSTGAACVAIGRNTTAPIGEGVTLVGSQATIENATITEGNFSTAIGFQARYAGSRGISLGSFAISTTDSTTLGYASSTRALGAIAVGGACHTVGVRSILIGYNQTVEDTGTVVIGSFSGPHEDKLDETNNCVAVGFGARYTGGSAISIGEGPIAHVYGIAIGGASMATDNNAISIGYLSRASAGRAVAIGRDAIAEAGECIQLGVGTNNEASSLQFKDFQLLNSLGKIPRERLPDEIIDRITALEAAVAALQNP